MPYTISSMSKAQVMMDELECTERYLEFVKESLDWLGKYSSDENVNGWIANQREMLEARIRRNKATIKSVTE